MVAVAVSSGRFHACLARLGHPRDKDLQDLVANRHNLVCPFRHVKYRAGEAYCLTDHEGVHLPTDASDMCKIMVFLQERGRLRRNGTLVDVGAAFGGEIAVGQLFGYQVIAYEGRPVEAASLKRQCAHPDTKVLNALVTNDPIPTVRKLYNAEDSSSVLKGAVSSGGELMKRRRVMMRDKTSFFNVAAYSIDYTMQNTLHLPVAVIKVDVQGFEKEVLEGANATMRLYAPVLHFEYSPEFRGADAPEVICLAFNAGYECARVFGSMITCIKSPF